MIYNPNEKISVPKIGVPTIGIPKISLPNAFGSVVREEPDKPKYPDWFMESIALWLDPKVQGCTNAEMAVNPILMDLSGNGNDMLCSGFAWTNESGISEDGEYIVFDGVTDSAECIGDLVLPDMTMIFNRDLEKFKKMVDDPNTSSYFTPMAKSRVLPGPIYIYTLCFMQIQPNESAASDHRLCHALYGTNAFFNSNVLIPNTVDICTSNRYYKDINNLSEYYNLNRGSMVDTKDHILCLGKSTTSAVLRAPLSVKQLFLFNRVLTADEINWVKINLIRQ